MALYNYREIYIEIKSTNDREVPMPRILRLPDVMKQTGLARSTIYKMIAGGSFPMQISLGAKSVGWLESDVEKWIQEKIANPKRSIKNIIH